jgi:hypothetical protein
MSLLVVFDILHAFFKDFSELLEIDIEISLHRCSNLNNNITDEFPLDLVQLSLRAILFHEFDIAFAFVNILV